VYCYNQGSGLSFTLPPALSGLTYMTTIQTPRTPDQRTQTCRCTATPL
jgi:hypothetical protein